jgi:hypothetical protein
VGPNDDNESVIYEVSLEADAAIAGPFDTWLRDHIADMLQFQGFMSAEILDDSAAPEGRICRIVQYRLRDQAALDAYLRDEAPRMRQEGIARFGDRFSAQRRLLAHREEFIRGAVSTENCLNCGEVLTGQHCSHCGQRSKVRVLSLTSLLRDLFGDLTEFDSRIWRTLRPLLFKPGLLTVEYLRGRRTHYSPPFRMYLVVSLVFFLAASFTTDPGGGLEFGVGPDGANLRIGGDGAEPGVPGDAAAPAATRDASAPAGSAGTPAETRPDATTAGTAQQGEASADNAAAAAALDEKRRQLIERLVSRLPPAERKRAREEFEKEFGQLTAAQVEPVRRLLDDPCGEDSIKLEIGPLGDKYEPRLRDACRKIMADSKSFGRALYENIPKMMFIFLPLIAALMFVLYIGSGRYYVEHLLFFVHYHSFFFAGGIVIILLDAMAVALDTGMAAGAVRGLQGVLTGVFVLYVPFYLYLAMRRVYGQGRWVTLTKFSLLGIGYLFFMTLTALGLLFYTALSL